MKTALKPNEKVSILVRQHWLTLVGPIFWTLVIIFVIIISYPQIDPKYSIYLTIAGAIPILWVIYTIIDRNSNIWVVTNLRVIDEHGVFSSNTKESPLDKINNVSYRKPFFGRIFNYGNVTIQTAAEWGASTHKMVERPALLKDTITKNQESYHQERIQEQAQKFATAVGIKSETSITDELTKLHELREKGVISDQEFQHLKAKILNN